MSSADTYRRLHHGGPAVPHGQDVGEYVDGVRERRVVNELCQVVQAYIGTRSSNTSAVNTKVFLRIIWCRPYVCSCLLTFFPASSTSTSSSLVGHTCSELPSETRSQAVSPCGPSSQIVAKTANRGWRRGQSSSQWKNVELGACFCPVFDNIRITAFIFKKDVVHSCASI